MNEYNDLKVQAQKQSARYLQELDSVNREQKADQDKLDNETRVRSDLEIKIKQKTHEKEEAQKRVDKLTEHIRASENGLEEQNRLYDELKGDVDTSKDRVAKLQRDLDNVTEQLGDAKVDKHDDNRRKKKQELVENFKRAYPGVYDRMINMCHPISNRYNVAITKVLGKYMEAIIVDSEATARLCIQYLKDHLLDPETFLPIDYLQTKPLKERLRLEITNCYMYVHLSVFLYVYSYLSLCGIIVRVCSSDDHYVISVSVFNFLFNSRNILEPGINFSA